MLNHFTSVVKQDVDAMFLGLPWAVFLEKEIFIII